MLQSITLDKNKKIIFLGLIISIIMFFSIFKDFISKKIIVDVIFFISLFILIVVLLLCVKLLIIYGKHIINYKICNINDKIDITFGLFLVVNFILMLIIYNSLLYPHYSKDSYIVALEGSYSTHLANGRPISAIIMYLIFDVLNINVISTQKITTILHCFALSLLITLIVLYLLKNEYRTIFTKFLVITVSTYIMMVNVFYFENFLFPEANILYIIIWGFTIFSSVIIANDNHIRYLFLSFLFLFISINMYQISISVFLIVSIFFVLIKENFYVNNKRTLTKILYCFIVGGSNAIVNILLTSLLQKNNVIVENERGAQISFYSIIENISNVTKIQKNILFDGYFILPRFTCLILGGSALIILLCLQYYNIKIKKYSIFDVAYFNILLLILYIIVFAPHIISRTYWPAQRTISPWFFYIGFLFITIVFYVDNRFIHKIVCIIMSLFLLINIYKINQVTINNILVNVLDKQKAYVIEEKINEYEIEFGQVIENVAFVNDTSPQWTYKIIKYNIFDTNVSAGMVPWGRLNYLKYYLERDLKEVAMEDDIYTNYFEGKNWEYFNVDEQIVFDGNTMYIAIE